MLTATRSLFLGLAAAALMGLAGCGSDETTTVVSTTTATAETGTSDEAGTTPSDDAPAASGPPDCLDLRKDLGEGKCELDGDEFVVVNRDSTLKLPELDAHLVDIETTDVLTDVGVERPNGVFLVVTLEVTNRLSKPVTFDENQSQVTFSIGRGSATKEYTEDFNAANGGDEQSFTWQYEPIQPDTTQTGTVIFDVPPEAVDALETTANIIVLNFSDAQAFGGQPKEPIGIIRTYAN